jgi:hypothetical protein
MGKDLIISILCTARKEKYLNRMRDLEPYLVLNNFSGSQVDLIADDTNPPDFVPYNFNWHRPQHEELHRKFWCYLDQVLDGDIPRWLIQCDDDCATDLSGLVKKLDQFYDYKDPVCVESHQNFDFVPNLYSAISGFVDKNLTYDARQWHISNMIHHHSWGSHVMSYGMLMEIKKWKKYKMWKKTVLRTEHSFSDQLATILAVALKIPCCTAEFIHSFNNIEEFTPINKNGKYVQIHYIHRLADNWNRYINLLTNKDIKKAEKIEYKVINRKPAQTLIDKSAKNYGKVKDFAIKLSNKMHPTQRVTLNVEGSGKAHVPGHLDMTWRPVGKNRMSLFHTKNKSKIGEIIKNPTTGEYLVVLDVFGKTSSTAWIGKEI